MAVTPLASAADLRTWLHIPADDTDTLSDEHALLLIEGVSRQVLTETGRSECGFMAGTVTGKVDGTGGPTITLPLWPVTAVASIIEDPDGLNIDLTGRFTWNRTGIVTRSDGGVFTAGAGRFTYTATAGWDTVPEDVRNLVCRVAARAFDNPTGLATESAGGYVAGFAFDETRLPTLSAPDRRELVADRL